VASAEMNAETNAGAYAEVFAGAGGASAEMNAETNADGGVQ
jgi:hypothetical protein